MAAWQQQPVEPAPAGGEEEELAVGPARPAAAGAEPQQRLRRSLRLGQFRRFATLSSNLLCLEFQGVYSPSTSTLNKGSLVIGVPASPFVHSFDHAKE